MHSSRMRTARPRIDHSARMWEGEVYDLSFLGQGGGPVRGRRHPPPRPTGAGHLPLDHVTYSMMHLVSPPPHPQLDRVSDRRL